MLHNKNYLILKEFLGDYNREIYGREISKKVKLSQKGIALALNDLAKMNILQYRIVGQIKYYRLNDKFSQIKDIIILTELSRKIDFLSKHRKLAHLFDQDDRIVAVFGSYSKNQEKKDSDLDLFIVGAKKIDDYNQKSNKFNLDISIKYFKTNEFKQLLKSKNPLINEIIRNHILISGFEKFVDIVWRGFNGHN